MTPLKVVFLSNWFDNPYKDLLINNLSQQDIEVKEYFRSTFFMHKVLRGWKPDIVHLQTLHYFFVSRNSIYYWFRFLVFISQLLLLRSIGIRTVWTVHEWTDKISGGKHNLSPRKARILGIALSGIITHCESTRKEMITELQLEQSEKVFVVPHGHYIDCYENVITSSKARETLGLKTQDVVFLYFGGIHPSKGVMDAVKAFESLDSHKNTTFIIAGKAGYKSIRESILEAEQSSDSIQFIHPADGIPDEDIQVYMNAADVVVLPYKVFTTSGVALLAMSFKKSCLAPGLGFFKDILGAGGAFLYDPAKPEGLKMAMEDAIANQANLTQMGLDNFQLVQKYNWADIAEKTAFVYRNT